VIRCLLFNAAAFGSYSLPAATSECDSVLAVAVASDSDSVIAASVALESDSMRAVGRYSMAVRLQNRFKLIKWIQFNKLIKIDLKLISTNLEIWSKFFDKRAIPKSIPK
jgi:hypothetical protein